MIEFTPGCHGKTLRKMTEDEVDLALETAEEEDRDLNANSDTEELWSLVERMAELVNERQEVKGSI